MRVLIDMAIPGCHESSPFAFSPETDPIFRGVGYAG